MATRYFNKNLSHLQTDQTEYLKVSKGPSSKFRSVLGQFLNDFIRLFSKMTSKKQDLGTILGQIENPIFLK